MAEPTTDAVSDERLTLAKDEGADFVLTALGKALGHEQWTQHDGSETWDGDVNATLMHLLWDAGVLDPETNAPLFGNRRSGTSQASEGEVVAWQGDAPDGRRGLTSNSKVAEMWKDVGRTVTPLYASPSKRVERLETADELIGGQSLSHIAELATMLGALKVGQPVTVSSQFHEAAMVLQALLGGRS